jgi:hypothetical protein
VKRLFLGGDSRSLNRTKRMQTRLLKYLRLPRRISATLLVAFIVLSSYGAGRLQDGHHPTLRTPQAISEASSQAFAIVALPTEPVSLFANSTPDFQFDVAAQTHPVEREQHAVAETDRLPQLSVCLKSTQMAATSL